MREPPRFSASTVLAVLVIVGAGAFAAGRSLNFGSSEAPSLAEKPAMAQQASRSGDPDLPPGHPPTGNLPLGHPSTGSGVGPSEPAVATTALSWKAPERWRLVPNASTMRLATYRLPHAPGDSEDPELTITQAGGSVDANAQRWIGQFGADGAKTAKRTALTVRGLEVTIVEASGKYANGMGQGSREEDQWALLGAIVSTPGMPHFLKLTGPVKSVKAARAEFDALVASVSPR